MGRWLVPSLFSIGLTLALFGAGSVASSPVPLTGAALQAGDFSLTCAGTCDPVTFDVDRAADANGWVEVRVHWDGTQTSGFALTVTAPDGSTSTGARGFDASRVQIFAAPAGTYTILLEGHGDVNGHIRSYDLDEPRQIGNDKLPNIVALAPVAIGYQNANLAEPTLAAVPGFTGCSPTEMVEQQARRCLRFGNAIGNTGDGPVQVFLKPDQAAMALATSELQLGMGHFTQRIYEHDGGFHDVAVGAADFHEAHGHWHYNGFADFKLYAVDENGIRGAEAATGHKSGFCFLDMGKMKEPDVQPQGRGHAESDCVVPFSTDGWSMGISVGYYDYYWAELDDQYVEMTGVGDGIYELVSRADPDGWLQETDEADNAASVLLKIEGDAVTKLEKRAWYHVPGF